MGILVCILLSILMFILGFGVGFYIMQKKLINHTKNSFNFDEIFSTFSNLKKWVNFSLFFVPENTVVF